MKILVTEPEVMAEGVKASLAALGDISLGPFDDRELQCELADAQVLMVRLGCYIGEAIFTQASRLRFVVTATTGLDHIDLKAAQAGAIRVISLRDCPEATQNISATAEHTLGLMLALVRHVPSATAHTLGGGWNRRLFWGTQLRGKRLGVIGYGRIGAMVARYAASLGMEVVACDITPTRLVDGVNSASLDELLESSDFVSVHVSAVPENRDLIDRLAIQKMKAGAVLINTARGWMVDETALAEAIQSGRLGGAAFDVLPGEEYGNVQSSPLLSCARAGYNVLVTPHIGGATYESIAEAEAAVVEVLAKLMRSDNTVL